MCKGQCFTRSSLTLFSVDRDGNDFFPFRVEDPKDRGRRSRTGVQGRRLRILVFVTVC